MKVSEILLGNILSYLKIDESDLSSAELMELDTLLAVAKKFIKSYTGLTDEQIDEHEDFVIVVYILVEDMYDNRTLYVDKNNLNKVVETILGMHSVNLL